MLGISTSSFYGRLSTEDAIYKIAEAGVGCAEVFLNSFSEYTYEYINMVSGRLRDSGLAFNSVHTLPTQFEPQLFAVTQRQRNDASYFFEMVLEGASKGGCSIYVMHGKPFFRKNTDSLKVDISSICERLNELCDIAEKYNMVIGMENVHWAMCNNLEFVNEVKSKVPKLKFTLDIKQAHLDGTGWQQYVTAYENRLVNIHICDYIGNKTCLPGRGNVDFNLLKKSLKNTGYNGNAILEVYEGDYTDFNDLQNCVDFCKGIF